MLRKSDTSTTQCFVSFVEFDEYLVPNRTFSYLFGMLRRHIRRVWSSHRSYFGERQSSQNTHGETKRAWHAAEAYQKGTIRYLPYPNSGQNLALR